MVPFKKIFQETIEVIPWYLGLNVISQGDAF